MFNKSVLENSAIYEIAQRKLCRGRQATDGNTIRYVRFACWITEATDPHSEHVILIALPEEQSFRHRAVLLL